MHTAKIGYVTVSAVMAVLGLLLMLNPSFSTALIGNLTGILLMLFGVIKLIGYFSKDLYRLAFQFDLGFGALLILLGAVILSRPENLLHFLCVVTGLYVMADGLIKLQTVLDAKSFGIKSWWAILIAAALTIICGMFLLLRPAESTALLMRLLGLVLLAEAALNLITVLMTVKIVRNQRPDIIEVSVEEEGVKHE